MQSIHTKVAVNKFVRRQILGSGKTYSSTLSFEEIAYNAEIQLKKGQYKPGYRDGVLIVRENNNQIKHYCCPFVKITKHSKLTANVSKRRDDEEHYIQIRALNGTPLQTASVDLILYRHDVLVETNEHSTQFEWELISFHAIPKGIQNMPMGPVTMMRNQLQLRGGTKAIYETNQWAESIRFWQNYAVLETDKSEGV